MNIVKPTRRTGTAHRLKALFDANGELALTRKELLDVLGVTPTTVDKAITELRSEGYLQSGYVYWRNDAQR